MNGTLCNESFLFSYQDMGGNPCIRNILKMVIQLTLDVFNGGMNGIRIWMDNCKPI